MLERHLLIVVLFLVSTLAATATAQTQLQPDQIAVGIRVGTSDLSNLRAAEAAQRLSKTVGWQMSKSVRLQIKGKTYRLLMQKVGFSFDAVATANAALAASKSPIPPGGVAIAPIIRFDGPAVEQFVAGLDKKFTQSKRDAFIRIGVRHISKQPARSGSALDSKTTIAAIRQAIVDPLAPREITPRFKLIQPSVRLSDLKPQYQTVVTIDRSNFKLRLFKNLRFVRSYPIAIGMSGYPTPRGRFKIQNKAINPTWHAPNEPWAGAVAGEKIPGGTSENPLKARWLGIANGVGIHGTAAVGSIGSAASHGCIRMRVEDVVNLYARVPIGTPVLID